MGHFKSLKDQPNADHRETVLFNIAKGTAPLAVLFGAAALAIPAQPVTAVAVAAGVTAVSSGFVAAGSAAIRKLCQPR